MRENIDNIAEDVWRLIEDNKDTTYEFDVESIDRKDLLPEKEEIITWVCEAYLPMDETLRYWNLLQKKDGNIVEEEQLF